MNANKHNQKQERPGQTEQHPRTTGQSDKKTTATQQPLQQTTKQDPTTNREKNEDVNYIKGHPSAGVAVDGAILVLE